MSEKINGDEVVVHSGDQIITLEQRLASMQTAIRRLWLALIVLIAVEVVRAIVSPEQFAQFVQTVLDVLT